MSNSPSKQLCHFVSHLDYADLPEDVVLKVQWLFLDWLGSAIAGSASRTSGIFEQLTKLMGPQSGDSTVIGRELHTSPLFAALVNGASSHVVEQDDLHNSSILHPGTVVFPPLLAAAQSLDSVSGEDFITAAVAGYEAGIRVGEYLGPTHYRIFHMTGTAGTIASAMATARLLNLNEEGVSFALGSAGTQAAGLWQFLGDAADSKQLHTAKASADGLLAAYSAQLGLTSASQILEGEQGLSAGMFGSGRDELIDKELGARWAVLETSFKYHASCRHTHPAADALLKICTDNNLQWQQVKTIDVYVYQAAKDVLGAVDVPNNIHQSKFSMGFVLALICRFGSASVLDFTIDILDNPEVAQLREKVTMYVDDDIENAYPAKWGARVVLELNDGVIHREFLDSPKGDPENMLTRGELEQKFLKLCGYAGMDDNSAAKCIEFCWSLPNVDSIKGAFSNLVAETDSHL